MDFALITFNAGSTLMNIYLPPLSNDGTVKKVEMKEQNPGLFILRVSWGNAVSITGVFEIPVHLWPSVTLSSIEVSPAPQNTPAGTTLIQVTLKSVTSSSSIGRFFRRQRRIEIEMLDYTRYVNGEKGGLICAKCSTTLVTSSELQSLSGVTDIPSEEWSASCDSLACEECAPLNNMESVDPSLLLSWLGVGDNTIQTSVAALSHAVGVVETQLSLDASKSPVEHIRPPPASLQCKACGEVVGRKRLVAGSGNEDFGYVDLYKAKVLPRAGNPAQVSSTGQIFDASAELWKGVYNWETEEGLETDFEAKGLEFAHEWAEFAGRVDKYNLYLKLKRQLKVEAVRAKRSGRVEGVSEEDLETAALQQAGLTDTSHPLAAYFGDGNKVQTVGMYFKVRAWLHVLNLRALPPSCAAIGEWAVDPSARPTLALVAPLYASGTSGGPVLAEIQADFDAFAKAKGREAAERESQARNVPLRSACAEGRCAHEQHKYMGTIMPRAGADCGDEEAGCAKHAHVGGRNDHADVMHQRLAFKVESTGWEMSKNLMALVCERRPLGEGGSPTG